MTKKDISFENVKAVVFIKASHKKGNKKIFAGYDTDGSCRLKKYDEETNQKIKQIWPH